MNVNHALWLFEPFVVNSSMFSLIKIDNPDQKAVLV